MLTKRLKISRGQPRAGSIPALGIKTYKGVVASSPQILLLLDN
jgi:hypothetical protein